MKSKALIIFILSLTLILTACGKSIEEKIGEKITEKIVEEAVGGDVKIDDDKTTIKTDQGSSQIGSDLDWPKEKMGNIPELKANLVAIFEDYSNKSIAISFEKFNLEDAKNYMNELKELGYSKGSESLSSDGLTFSGYKEDKTEVLLMFSAGSGTLVYMLESSAAESAFKYGTSPIDSSLLNNSDEFSDGGLGGGEASDITSNEEPEEIDMTDDVPWPKDFMGNIPELEGKIVGVNKSDGYINIDFQYVEKDVFLDYLKKVKELGFNVEASESTSSDYISYDAYNNKEEYLLTNWSSDGYAYIELSKP